MHFQKLLARVWLSFLLGFTRTLLRMAQAYPYFIAQKAALENCADQPPLRGRMRCRQPILSPKAANLPERCPLATRLLPGQTLSQVQPSYSPLKVFAAGMQRDTPLSHDADHRPTDLPRLS